MPRPLRLLQIAKHFHPDVGGIETVTRAISDGLIGHDVRADVLCTALHARGDVLGGAYDVLRCKTDLVFRSNKTLSLGYMRAIARLSPSYDIGLLHLPNTLAIPATLAFWRKPLVILWHADFPQGRLRPVGDLMDRAMLRRADAVIGPTRVHLEGSRLSQLLLPKSIIIPYPFSRSLPGPTRTSAIAAKAKSLARGRRIALSIGRLVAYKGFDVLIDAAAQADDVFCVIVGDGPQRALLADAIEARGVSDRVMLAGGVSDAELADLIDLAAFGCMPSVTCQEMYGMSQVELMSVGKPMVATDIPLSGVPCVTIAGQTGLIVPPGDSGALAAALQRLATDEPLYRQLCAGAAARFAAHHEGSSAAARYAELFRRVAGQTAVSERSNGHPAP